jgi:PAT family beta-lactamase induction signal transducer AmpG
MNQNKFLSQFGNFFIIFSLGFLSGLPASLFGTTLQAWFAKSGESILFVSSLSLLNLPFLFRFIWGPLVDKYYLSSIGRRKSWLIGIQLCLFLVIEGMALGSPELASHYLLVMSVFLVIASCIQDTVIDAHRIEFLPKHYFGYGAVVAIYAYRIALLVSGGLSLIIAQYFGFQLTYALMGGIFLIGIVIVYFSQEPHVTTKKVSHEFGPFKDFFKQPKLIALIGIVLCTKFGEVFVSNTSPMIIPFMLQGLGLSLTKIAYINKIFGLLAQLVGSAIAALFVSRFSLLQLLLGFGILEIISNLMFLGISLYPLQELHLWGAVAFENLATGLCSTVLVAFLMGLVNPNYTATQFSIWITIAIIPKLLAGPVGGYLSSYYGWPVMFAFSTVMTAFFLFFWLNLKKSMHIKNTAEEN